MAAITLAQAQVKLDSWMEAEDALQHAQEYSMPGGNQNYD